MCLIPSGWHGIQWGALIHPTLPMTNARLTFALLAAIILGLSTLGAPSAEAGDWSGKQPAHCGPYGCEPLNPYDPPKGVYKICSWKKGKKRWIQRSYKLPSGEKTYYRIQTVTYRTRYSNGVIHDLVCALPETEVALAAPGEAYSPGYSK